MKKSLFFLLIALKVYAFDLPQTYLPLSTFGDVIYDIYQPEDTVCEAGLVFQFAPEDLIGNYVVEIKPFHKPLFQFSQRTQHVDFRFDPKYEISQVFFQESTTQLLKFSYMYTHPARESQRVVTLPIVMPRKQFARPGKYAVDLLIEVHFQDELILRKIMPATIQVEEHSQIMISENVDDSFEKTQFVRGNFGQIEETVTKSSYLSIKANYDFALEVESKNHGVMVRKDRKRNTSGISFDLVIDRLALDLKEGSVVLPLKNGENRNIPLNLTLYPDAKTHLAGSYQDTLLLSIISMN